MTPKEFQKSHLTVELKAGKKRLEDALRGLSGEQCERPGATRSGSVMDLLAQPRALKTARGISSPIGKPFSGERIRQAYPFVGARFGHGRVAR